MQAPWKSNSALSGKWTRQVNGLTHWANQTDLNEWRQSDDGPMGTSQRGWGGAVITSRITKYYDELACSILCFFVGAFAVD